MRFRDRFLDAIRGEPADCMPAAELELAGDQRWALGQRNRLRWFFSGIWLAYLIQPVADLFDGHHGALWIAGGLAIVAVFCTVYIALICTWNRYPRLALRALAVIAALAVLGSVVYGKDWTVLWIYVSAATGVAITRRRQAMVAVLVAGACYALLSWLAHVATGEFLGVLLPVVLVGLMMTGFRMQIALMRELSQTRETVARLAANEERLRLARDLHDLTGHSLSLVTLKAELAQRMLGRLPESPERDRAVREIADIERVSRQTLHDIREAVSGYRRPTLAVEFAAARTALEAAGIRLDADPALPRWPGLDGEEREAALAWCLREAVTNVIRHSGARSCRVRLLERAGELSLEVADDGRGLAGPEVASMPPAGSGLHGMAERLSAVGGRLSVAPARAAGEPGPGFRLLATVPVSREDGAELPSGLARTTVNIAR